MAREMLDTRVFGGNHGQQGVFDRNDPNMKNEALQRLQELTSQYGAMLDSNYTGETGFAANDADSYYKWRNATTEADNINRSLGGKAGMNIHSVVPQGGELSAMNPQLRQESRLGPDATGDLVNKHYQRAASANPAMQSLSDLIMRKRFQ